MAAAMETIIKAGQRPGGPVIVTLQGSSGVRVLKLTDSQAGQLKAELAAGRRNVRGMALSAVDADRLRGQLAALLGAA